jgi:hypothetical protein
VTQPWNRSTCDLPELGAVDRQAGEFWVRNPFHMPLAEENLSAYERNRTFMNLNGKRFVDVSFASGADLDSDSRSVVVGDFDRDGAEDILVASIGGGPLRLFRNKSPNIAHRSRIELIGRTSNRSAIGARVIATCGDRQIYRDLFPAHGFMGQSPPEIHLGLGAAERIDRLTVRWPSGLEQTFEDLPANCRITITEGDAPHGVARLSGAADRKRAAVHE